MRCSFRRHDAKRIDRLYDGNGRTFPLCRSGDPPDSLVRRQRTHAILHGDQVARIGECGDAVRNGVEALGAAGRRAVFGDVDPYVRCYAFHISFFPNPSVLSVNLR